MNLRTAFISAAQIVWFGLLLIKSTILHIFPILNFFRRHDSDPLPLPAAGKTVLVTTGRQAKALHTVRALKEIGARVIVTDYEPISASAVSLACDHFVQLDPLRTPHLDEWIDHFEQILVEHRVDIVIPVSTINEVLFLGAARDQLSARLPHVRWICPTLAQAISLDDRVEFAALCHRHEIPAPECGIIDSRASIAEIARRFPSGAVFKRVEASVNRALEIVHVRPGATPPSCIAPTSADRWQWQRFVRGTEYSAWYICIDGRVTMSACYLSAPDLMHFDPVDVPDDLDAKVRALARAEGLTGQFAFDFFRCADTGQPLVIECNPRASSILETVSRTPRWGEAFLGTDVSARIVRSSVGFVYHMNCWPWTRRADGHFRARDPLPFFAAQVAWPLMAIGSKGMGEKGFQHVDVNICKIIVEEPSAARDLDVFRARVHRGHAPSKGMGMGRCTGTGGGGGLQL